jgi:MoaA/NifB/PqqE/SkfB family radical SAM enzyme
MREFPLTVGIEVTNICNARCRMCSQRRMTRKKGVMESGLFQRIIEQLKGSGVRFLFLFGIGEPFSFRGYLDYLRYARKALPGVTLHVTTNGSFLNEAISEEIVRQGLIDEMAFSVHGGTREAYEETTSLDYDRLISNIQSMITMKRKMKKKKPILIINSIYTPKNLPSIEFLERDLPDVDQLRVSVMDNFAGDAFPLEREEFPRTAPCPAPFENLTVLVDGRVALCCYDFDGSVILGDLRKETIREVWMGEKFQRIREAMENQRFEDLPLCSHCTGIVKEFDLAYLRGLCLRSGMEERETDRLLAILQDVRIRNHLKNGHPVQYRLYRGLRFLTRGDLQRFQTSFFYRLGGRIFFR